ncbi:hypothetical protein ACES2L_13990 [Bdellovibrio bacteriovorus]
MRNHYLVIFILGLLLSGCVTVQLPGGKVTSAKDVEYKQPAGAFKEIKNADADKSWISANTGNTISYFTECGGKAEPTLNDLENDAFAALSDSKVLSSEEVNYNERAARQSRASGKLDGVPVELSLIVFQKNGCNYTLTYGGLAKSFSVEAAAFEEFKNNFKAP